MTGKTIDEIVAVVGQPSSRSSMAHGQLLLQWQATGYHMALLFNPEGQLVKITHESAHFAPPPPPSGCLGLVAILACTALIIICAFMVIVQL
ncbi:MAG: hypothetical protein WAK13_10535 [Terriglobales bacterium]